MQQTSHILLLKEQRCALCPHNVYVHKQNNEPHLSPQCDVTDSIHGHPLKLDVLRPTPIASETVLEQLEIHVCQLCIV